MVGLGEVDYIWLKTAALCLCSSSFSLLLLLLGAASFFEQSFGEKFCAGGSSRTMGNDDDVWKQQRGRNRIDCGTDGCGGMCPEFVIAAGLRPNGSRATCKECGVPYKLPRGSKAQTKAKGKPTSEPDRVELTKLRRELAKSQKKSNGLQMELQKARSTATTPAAEAAGAEAEAEVTIDEAKADIDRKVDILDYCKQAPAFCKDLLVEKYGTVEVQQAAIDSARILRRTSLPTKTRQRIAHEKVRKLAASLKGKKDLKEKLETRMAELQKQLDEVSAEVITIQASADQAAKEAADVARSIAKEKEDAAGISPGLNPATLLAAQVVCPGDAEALSSVVTWLGSQTDTMDRLAKDQGVSTQQFGKGLIDLCQRVESAGAALGQSPPEAIPAPARVTDVEALPVPAGAMDVDTEMLRNVLDESMAEINFSEEQKQQLLQKFISTNAAKRGRVA